MLLSRPFHLRDIADNSSSSSRPQQQESMFSLACKHSGLQVGVILSSMVLQKSCNKLINAAHNLHCTKFISKLKAKTVYLRQLMDRLQDTLTHMKEPGSFPAWVVLNHLYQASNLGQAVLRNALVAATSLLSADAAAVDAACSSKGKKSDGGLA